MKILPRRDIPKGAAAVVVALVLVAGIVTGRESPPAPVPVSMKVLTPQPGDELDVSALSRQRSTRPATDLFVRHSWVPPAPPPQPAPAPAVVAPPPPPQAPSLPFKYLGRMVKPDTTLVYLLKGEELFVVEAGTTLADYRVESISDTEIAFVYVPLATKQILSAAATP